MKLVIFDLDDTLVDFASTRRMAYAEMAVLLDREGIDSTAFLDACVQVDRPLFLQFEQGQLTREVYRQRRFSDPFGIIGMAPRAELSQRLNKVFMDCVNDRPLLYSDVLPVLSALRKRGVATAILTNGPSDGQRRKLQATGLAEWVDHVAIGEEIGVSKPSARAFGTVVAQCRASPGETLMVGDSPHLDYDGAIAASLRALLLDRDARYDVSGRRCIRSLHEVLHRHTGGPASCTGA